MATQGISTKPQSEDKTRGVGNIVTGETLENTKTALHVLDKSTVSQIATDVVDSIAANIITAAAHSALKGDVIRMSSGAASGSEYRVFAITTNTITFEQDTLTTAPVATDTFEILRPTSMTVSTAGLVTVTVTLDPIEYNLDTGAGAVATTVLEDTSTPADTRPLPVRLFNSVGDQLGTATDPVRTDTTGTTTQPISAASLPLPTGAATEATLTTIDTDTGNIATDTAVIAADTTSLDAKAPAQGAAVIAASTPVNIASDQTVPISAASLPLPTGAATEATLVTIDTDTGVIAGDTTSIDGKTPALGSAVSASSVPVVIASDQGNVPVSQVTHDSLNLNANIQVGDADNSATNPVFTDRLNVVDLLDTPLLDATTLNGSGGALVDVVANLASAVKKVQLISTAGVFIGLFDDTVLAAQFGPGSDDTVEISIAATSVIALRSLETAAPSGGSIVVNFLG